MSSLVLHADCSDGHDHFATKTFTPPATPWFIQFDVYVAQSMLDAVAATAAPDAFTADFIEIGSPEDDGIFLVYNEAGSGIWQWETDAGSGAVGSVTGDTWYVVSVSYDGATITWKINGSVIDSYANTVNLNRIRFGAEFSNGVAGEVYTLDNIKVGASAGGTDYFCDDFESGTFSLWTSVSSHPPTIISFSPNPPSTGCAPDFSFTLTPNALTIAQSGSDTSALATTPISGDTESITLSATGQPAGVTVGFSANPIVANGAGSTITVNVGPAVPGGTYPITIHAVGSSNTHTQTLTLTVPSLVPTNISCDTAKVIAPSCAAFTIDNSLAPTTAPGSDPLHLVYYQTNTFERQLWYSVKNTTGSKKYARFTLSNPEAGSIQLAAGLFTVCPAVAAPSVGTVDGFSAIVPGLGTGVQVRLGVLLDPGETAYIEVASFNNGWSGLLQVTAELDSVTVYDGIDEGITPLLGYPASVEPGVSGPLGGAMSYCHGGGAHFGLYAATRPVVNQSAFPPNLTNFHALAVQRVSDDGSTQDIYFIDTLLSYRFHANQDSYLFCQEFHVTVSFTQWDMIIWDAKIATDGTTVWVAVLASETIAYPHLSTLDGTTPPGCHAGGYPSQATQFQPLSTLEATYAPFVRFQHTPSGLPSAGSSPPDSDGGDNLSGQYSPVRLIVFSAPASGGAFTRVDTVDAKYNQTPGAVEVTPNTFLGPVEIAASPAEPGVCHVMWSEGGGFGTRGNGHGGSGTGGPGPLVYDVWDKSYPTMGFRVNYSRWSSAAKTLDTDILVQEFDRSAWFFIDQNGTKRSYSFPTSNLMAATGLYALRNEHGSPVAFIAKLLTKTSDASDSDFYPNQIPDFAEVTVRMWDLTSGAPVELATITSDLLPTDAEAANQSPFAGVRPTRLIYNWPRLGGGPSLGDLPGGHRNMPGFHLSGGSSADGFAVSSKFHDPLLGKDVYAVGVQWAVSSAPSDSSRSRGIYRIPCDGSAPFSVIYGDRTVGIFPNLTHFINNSAFYTTVPPLVDFFADGHDVWVPFTVPYSFYYSPDCLGWIQLDGLGRGPFATYPHAGEMGGSMISTPPYYDPVTDRFYLPGVWDPNTSVGTSYVGIGVSQICRGCEICTVSPCVSGLHIMDRIPF